MMTPAARRTHIIKDFIDIKITEYDARRRTGHLADWHAVIRHLRSRTWTIASKKALLRLATGQEHTRSGVHQHGYSSGDQCPCGTGPDTYGHRLAGCEHFPLHNHTADTMQDVHEALTFRPAPAHDDYKGVICKINGEQVAEDDFHWIPGSPVYTDCSCKYVTDPYLAISAAAAVQVLPHGGTRTVTTDIVRTRPQAAVFGEHVALFLAAHYHQPDDTGIQVVADCQAVVDGFHQTPAARLNLPGQIWRIWDAGTRSRPQHRQSQESSNTGTSSGVRRGPPMARQLARRHQGQRGASPLR
jgi:hypothetical protein